MLNAALIERIKRTSTVESFRFTLEKKIDFLPGQFLQVIFNAQNIQDKDLNKYLSFSNAPQKDYIEFTKKLSNSVFSDKLRELKTGDPLKINGPLGKCVFEDNHKKIGFLIGGIGITPVISIIEYIVLKTLDTDIALLYSNRTEDEIAFKPELDNWHKSNKNLKICYTITDCQPKEKTCLFGPITPCIIKEKIADFKERIIFIFGPPKMVEAMKNLCLEIGCEAENLKTENFIGY